MTLKRHVRFGRVQWKNAQGSRNNSPVDHSGNYGFPPSYILSQQPILTARSVC